jgi:nucleolin
MEAKAEQMLEGRAMNVDFSQPRNPADPVVQLKRARQYGDKLSEPSNTIFIGNLSFDADQESVREAFTQFGEITRVALPTDRDTGALKGFAYVSFTKVKEAKQAVDNMQGVDVAGRSIRLDFAKARDDGDNNRSGGYGDRSGGYNDRSGGFNDRRGGGRGRGGFGGRGGGGRGGGRGFSRY